MKLEFNSVGELSEFLEFSKLLGSLLTEAKANVTMNVSVTPPANPLDEVLKSAGWTSDGVHPKWDMSPGADIGDAEQGNESAPTEQPDTESESTPQPAIQSGIESPKRKRRTKAEMEAARAAESAETGSEVPASTEQSNTASVNPFEANAASPTTQAILNAPNQQAATLAGIAAMQTQSPFEPVNVPNPSESVAQTVQETMTGTTDSDADADTFIEARSLELLTSGEPLTPIKHMHVCREFIARHGQAKYLQGFTLAGLPATVGTYKAEQCARHQAALEFLNAN